VEVRARAAHPTAILIAQLVADAPVIQAGVGAASQRQIQVTYAYAGVSG